MLYSSEPFLGEAYREAIARVNGERPGSFDRLPSTREILDHVGWPLRVILARLFPQADPEAVQRLNMVSLDVICEHVMAGEGILYPDVADTLRALGERYALCVASNGRSRYIEAVLGTYGLSDCFAARITADQVGDKAAILRAYLARHGVTAAQTVMIGDRTSDVEAAQAIGCPFVGCDYGHGYRDEIAAAGPIVARFRDLPGVVEQVLMDKPQASI